jgi:hypothetical protein
VAISLTSDFLAGLPDSLNIVPEWLLGFALGSGVGVKHRKGALAAMLARSAPQIKQLTFQA